MTVVGTWNLENLFKPGADFGPGSEAVYRKKLRELATTIDEAGVDVASRPRTRGSAPGTPRTR